MGAGTYPEAKQAKELAARYHSCARPAEEEALRAGEFGEAAQWAIERIDRLCHHASPRHSKVEGK